jgi:hydrogenase maturation protease
MTVLVVGIGNADRGDDGIGPAVAARVRERALPGVDVLVLDDPLALLDAWEGYETVAVVDAVRSGAVAGTIHVRAAGRDDLPLAPAGRGDAGSTHGFGVAAAVGLGRALHRLPVRLVLVGVEGRCFDHGAALSPEVAAAVGAAGDQVVEAVVPDGEVSHVPR